MDNRAYEYWLFSTNGIGLKTYKRLLERNLSAKEIFEMTDNEFESLEDDKFFAAKVIQMLKQKRLMSSQTVIEQYQNIKEKGINYTVYGEDDYPKHLYNIPDPPLVVYYKGSLPKGESLRVAVIGARDCTEYGKYIASELGRELALHNIALISGMARGIDGISQMESIKSNGETYAVLGSGVDVCYPKENSRLYEYLCSHSNAGVLSEYAPQTEARSALFPPRNRIISGLSDVIVVIEARLKSGTLITVDMALEQGKEVYAVPGRITDRLSDGCNQLIKEGAIPFLSPSEFVRDILDKKESILSGRQDRAKNKSALEEDYIRNELCKQNNNRNIKKALQNECRMNQLSTIERRIYEQLDFMPKGVDEIMNGVKDISIREVLCAITALQMKGYIAVKGNQYYRKL